jgi:phosphatidylglycerol:prolipoprotein diacylglycerol transferase
MDITTLAFLFLGGAGVGFGIYRFIKSLTHFYDLPLTKQTPYQTLGLNHFFYIFLAAVGLGVMSFALVQDGGEGDTMMAFANPFLLMLSGLWLWTAIRLKGKKDISDQFHPLLSSTIILLIVPTAVFFYLTLESIEPIFTYPLPKGIPFESPLVTFYAIFILTGAILAYQLTEYEFVKRGKKKGFVEDVFVIAFPAGILGARLWYVWGQWDLEFAGEPLWKIFAVWEGGLAIMGGALGGALVGILYVLWKRKDIPIIQAVDWAIPTILVAQAIGRWGNFFNQEVYGAVADVNQWLWLPTFVREQMTIFGEFRTPLFLIESFINLTGFFVLKFGMGVGLAKWIKQGDIALGYLVWYGLTRGIMEPLRDPTYNMGNQGQWSFIWGWVFFAVGIIAILANHIIQDHWKKRHV